MLLCQIQLILIILIRVGKREKVPFFEVFEQFSFHVSKVLECLKLNRPGFGYYLLL